MFGGFFEKKTVLVTGLAGAKGTWLGWYLLEAGARRIVGVDNATSLEGTCFKASGLADDSRVSLYAVDVRDLDGLRATIRNENTSAAVHLAAMAIVGQCKERPLDAYSTNVLGTATFLEALRTTELERAVVITTDKVYRDKGGESWVEDDALVASGPYAISKAAADLIAQDYYQGFLRPARKHMAIARSGNVLVPGDHHEGRIFVDIAHALSRDRPPVILNPSFTRPYTFVGDVVAGYLSLLSHCERDGVRGEPFNFGPVEPRGIPNGDLAARMCELWGSGIKWVRGTKRDEPYEHQSLDSSKAEGRLDWRPAYELEEGLAATVEWYKQAASGPPAGHLRTLALQIARQHIASARRQGILWAASSA